MSGVVTALQPSMGWDVHLRCPPIRVAPPAFGTLCAAPCPATVRREVPPAPQTLARPPAATERFNLIVPTSLLEKSFDMNSVLQRGLTVVFKMVRGGSAPLSKTLGAAYGYVTRHVNPIGLTTYRVCGQHPLGAGSGCLLHGWSTEDGCLVVEVMERQQTTPMQEPPTAPTHRLFGDCLPSPATIRKPHPRSNDLLNAPSHQQSLQSEPEQQNLLQRLHQETVAPTALLDTQQEQWRQQQKPADDCRVGAGSPSQGQSCASDSTCAGSPTMTDDTSIVLPAKAAPVSCCTSDPSTTRQAPCENAAPVCELNSKLLTRYKAAALESMTPTEPCKRSRRAVSERGSVDPYAELHAGIDLLLAAHVTLCQLEEGRPKRTRVQKSYST
ncbi:hypothetical protein Agub_g8469 [Astrephomene gubernaculifera]|uniref:Uncharacterized protein n=1 Tax=Astrephomene gubernaculifera TaxID=47775 RepID=A0AAD3HN68_9CHLO|nr:hypothetical protein Agub_g8469 [Astrephomene gubernaculifera]